MQDDVLRASEIGEYLYCHRAWWLGRVLGLPNANQAALQAGTTRHRAHGATVRRADALERFAAVLVLIAFAALALLLLGWMGVW
jgi:hypothetical protein